MAGTRGSAGGTAAVAAGTYHETLAAQLGALLRLHLLEDVLAGHVADHSARLLPRKAGAVRARFKLQESPGLARCAARAGAAEERARRGPRPGFGAPSRAERAVQGNAPSPGPPQNGGAQPRSGQSKNRTAAPPAAFSGRGSHFPRPFLRKLVRKAKKDRDLYGRPSLEEPGSRGSTPQRSRPPPATRPFPRGRSGFSLLSVHGPVHPSPILRVPLSPCSPPRACLPLPASPTPSC